MKPSGASSLLFLISINIVPLTAEFMDDDWYDHRDLELYLSGYKSCKGRDVYKRQFEAIVKDGLCLKANDLDCRSRECLSKNITVNCYSFDDCEFFPPIGKKYYFKAKAPRKCAIRARHPYCVPPGSCRMSYELIPKTDTETVLYRFVLFCGLTFLKAFVVGFVGLCGLSVFVLFRKAERRRKRRALESSRCYHFGPQTDEQKLKIRYGMSASVYYI